MLDSLFYKPIFAIGIIMIISSNVVTIEFEFVLWGGGVGKLINILEIIICMIIFRQFLLTE